MKVRAETAIPGKKRASNHGEMEAGGGSHRTIDEKNGGSGITKNANWVEVGREGSKKTPNSNAKGRGEASFKFRRWTSRTEPARGRGAKAVLCLIRNHKHFFGDL